MQHNLAFNYPFPLAIEKACGAYLWDVDGNQYIDFLQAGGPTVLGSNYAPVREKVCELLQDCGPVTGLFHEYELKLAQLIQRYLPSIEMFRMLGSGTESVMAGIGGTGERAYIGGTLSANPLSCVAGYYALLEMERTHAPVIAGRTADRLTKLNSGCC